MLHITQLTGITKMCIMKKEQIKGRYFVLGIHLVEVNFLLNVTLYIDLQRSTFLAGRITPLESVIGYYFLKV